MKTRDKILQTAIRSFNEKGFGAVNLLEIAQTMGISRGNLTYHFKTKELLLEGIVKQMWERIENEKKIARQLPSFENMHNEIKLYYKIQLEYSFVFLDPYVAEHVLVRAGLREMIKQSIEDYMGSIAFAIQLKNMKPEPVPGTYQSLAFTVWMLVYYWLAQQTLRGIPKGEDAEKIVWALIVPHMTAKGVKAFKKFFGEAYYNAMGTGLEVDLQKLLSLKGHW